MMGVHNGSQNLGYFSFLMEMNFHLCELQGNDDDDDDRIVKRYLPETIFCKGKRTQS